MCNACVLDNSALIAPFCPPKDDGDSFIYTEMLDRGKKKGNNGHRLVKTFYHRSVEEFWEQWPSIKRLCDLSLVRACTRLAPRSWKRVGCEFTRMVVEASLSDNWVGMKSLYNRACGIAGPNKKLWLWDVDKITDVSAAFGKWLQQHSNPRGIDKAPLLVATIPSKKGVHYISHPFEVARVTLSVPGVQHNRLGVDFEAHDISLHKDNPTNLYIPDGAD